MALRNSFTDILHKVGKEDPNLVVLVGDISHFRLQPFAKDCPGRYYNVGICEPTIVNMAAGLSKVGLHPVIHTISPFIVERSFEQIKLDFGYQGFGGNIMTAGSAFDYATLGCTHHCYSDFALLKTLPNTELFYPAGDVEGEALFRQVYNNRKMSFFRLPMAEHGVHFNPSDIKVGKGIRVKEGEDLTIVAVGTQLKTVLASVSSLEGLELNPEVIYIHTVKPLDIDLIKKSVSKTKRCLVIEEHGEYGGVYDEVIKHCYDIPDVKFSTISIPNKFIREYGSYEEICARLGFSVEGILKKVNAELRTPGLRTPGVRKR